MENQRGLSEISLNHFQDLCLCSESQNSAYAASAVCAHLFRRLLQLGVLFWQHSAQVQIHLEWERFLLEGFYSRDFNMEFHEIFVSEIYNSRFWKSRDFPNVFHD